MIGLLRRLAAWLAPAPPPPLSSVTAPPLSRPPTPADLLAELRDTAWTCATINAATCAAHPPRLFAVTRPGQAPPRAATRALAHLDARRLARSGGPGDISPPGRVEEVTDHPLLTLLRQVNPTHNALHP